MTVITRSRLAGLNFEKMLEDMPASQKMKDIEKDWLRMQEVLELKEEHPKEYLLKKGLVTEEEYNKYKGKSLRRLEFEKNVAISRLASNPNPIRDMGNYSN